MIVKSVTRCVHPVSKVSMPTPQVRRSFVAEKLLFLTSLTSSFLILLGIMAILLVSIVCDFIVDGQISAEGSASSIF
jgi:hypothetical protein